MRYLALLLLAGCFNAGSVRMNGGDTPSPMEIAGERLDDEMLTKIDQGGRVSLPSVFWQNDGKVIATTSFVRLPGHVAGYTHILDDVTNIHNWLPFNREARIVGERADAKVVQISQGFAKPLQANLSVLARREGRVMRWELDPSRPHDVRDTWGYVALRPHGGNTLMIVVVALDLGQGIVRDLLEREVHKMMGWAVENARSYFIGQREGEPCTLATQ